MLRLVKGDADTHHQPQPEPHPQDEHRPRVFRHGQSNIPWLEVLPNGTSLRWHFDWPKP